MKIDKKGDDAIKEYDGKFINWQNTSMIKM